MVYFPYIINLMCVGFSSDIADRRDKQLAIRSDTDMYTTDLSFNDQMLTRRYSRLDPQDMSC